jgi:hypothetical protein
MGQRRRAGRPAGKAGGAVAGQEDDAALQEGDKLLFLFHFFFLVGLTSGPSVHVSKPIFLTSGSHLSDSVAILSQFAISANCK